MGRARQVHLGIRWIGRGRARKGQAEQSREASHEGEHMSFKDCTDGGKNTF